MNGFFSVLGLPFGSNKNEIDTRMRFSVEPHPGDNGFAQWRDALKAVARLPEGVPHHFRKTFWLRLADRHLEELSVDWEKTRRLAFNDRTNPDDNKLGIQIVKDLHRTGSSCTSAGFLEGTEAEEDRAMLKRVLLAYARWNKSVGYCQGFNVLAALILQVMEKREAEALKVMIFLIDHILPNSYFANNLRALSVDMAVFRDLLRQRLPQLSKHMDNLQSQAKDAHTGDAIYEPPLTNMFTMQWFLTLFATCLPRETVLKVWDSILLEGSEILLRTGLAIWETLAEEILTVQSCDEFYTKMGSLSQEMLQLTPERTNALLKKIYGMSSFPYPQLTELREKYTYDITPFSSSGNRKSSAAGKNSNNSGAINNNAGGHGSVGGQGGGRRRFVAIGRTLFNELDDDDVEMDEEEMRAAVNCFSGSPTKGGGSALDVGSLSPGALTTDSAGAAVANPLANTNALLAERMTTDLRALRRKYQRIKQRQQQAHVILLQAGGTRTAKSRDKGNKYSNSANRIVMPSSAAPRMQQESGIAINHLFIEKSDNQGRNKRVGVAHGVTTCAAEQDQLGKATTSNFPTSPSSNRSTGHATPATTSSESAMETTRVVDQQDLSAISVLASESTSHVSQVSETVSDLPAEPITPDVSAQQPPEDNQPPQVTEMQKSKKAVSSTDEPKSAAVSALPSQTPSATEAKMPALSPPPAVTAAPRKSPAVFSDETVYLEAYRMNARCNAACQRSVTETGRAGQRDLSADDGDPCHSRSQPSSPTSRNKDTRTSPKLLIRHEQLRMMGHRRVKTPSDNSGASTFNPFPVTRPNIRADTKRYGVSIGLYAADK